MDQQQECLQKDTESTIKKRGSLVKIQQALILAQEVGDEKLQIIQQLQDLIENKARQLEIDYRNLGKNIFKLFLNNLNTNNIIMTILDVMHLR